MASQIRVVPDALRSAAEHVRSIAAGAAEAVDRGSNIAVEVFDAWEGKGGESVISLMDEIRATASKVVSGVLESATVLLTVADAFESVDRGEGTPIATFASVVPLNVNIVIGGKGGTFKPWLNSGGTVRIVPERVRELAVQFRSIAETYEETSAAFRSLVSKLENDWEGNAYNRFADSCVGITGAFAQLQSSIITVSDAMIEAANRYEDLDNSL